MAVRRKDDDSSEEEPTAIDLGRSPARKSIPSRPAPPAPAVRVRPQAPMNRSPMLHEEESGDEEATEFLAVRPPGPVPAKSDPRDGKSKAAPPSPPRARGRAIPLEGQPGGAPEDADDSTAERLPSSTKVAREPTEPLLAVASPPPALPKRTPRPLPARGSPLDLASEAGDTNTASAPRITRIAASPPAPAPRADGIGTAPVPVDVDAGEPTEPPRPGRPGPAGTGGIAGNEERRKAMRPFDNPPTDVLKQDSSETLEPDEGDGTLIIEVPDGAIIFINGVERGHGPTAKVEDLDRHARHAIRIHCAGYQPWNGSVCLEGRAAAKVRPTLKKRDPHGR